MHFGLAFGNHIIFNLAVYMLFMLNKVKITQEMLDILFN